MDVDHFDFALPDTHIALRPVEPRDTARLLVVNPSKSHVFKDKYVRELPTELVSGDLLVINNTKVFPAFLRGRRSAREHGGGSDVMIDVNLHKRVSASEWQAFVRPAKRLRDGDNLFFSNNLVARVKQKAHGGDTLLQFSSMTQADDDASNALTDQELLDAFYQIGEMPLPPYIARRRKVDARDLEDYQTTFARSAGSVAAPTAGLHFTPELLARLEARGVERAELTLHVGAGTFLPVTANDTREHKMHSEWYDVAPDVAAKITQAKKDGRRIIAVGTTSLRTLESAWTIDGLRPGSAETDIFITPGYTFKCVDGLMTNFHLPRSTLFMLVCAFSGTDIMKSAYAHAISENYRFYSYGDSSLLWRSSV